jgi:colanic acid biosynthesis glycosyl transferase WcaI
MSRKHILFISQYFQPDFGGSATRAYNAARGLIMNGCDVTVITAFPHYPEGHIPLKYARKIIALEEMDGIRLIRTFVPSLPHSSPIKRIIIHSSFMLSSLLGLFYVKDIDTIFAMSPNMFSVFPSLFYRFFSRKGIKIIRNVDDLWPEVFYDLGLVKSKVAKSILDWISLFTYRKSASIIPVSRGYVTTLVNKYHIEKERIHVIEHGVDTSIFRPIADESREMTSNNRIIIMYSGAINVGYDFELLFKVAKILEWREEIRFIIRGVGDYTLRVMDLLSKYRSTNVEVFTDMLPKDQLISLLNRADIFVLPMRHLGSIDRGFPTKILEYQALGKPIVCISDGEAARYIKETNSGLVTASRDPHKVASLLMRLESDRMLATQLGRNGLKNIEERLSLEKIGQRLLQVIGT